MHINAGCNRFLNTKFCSKRKLNNDHMEFFLVYTTSLGELIGFHSEKSRSWAKSTALVLLE